jgi:hypothetical protein
LMICMTKTFSDVFVGLVAAGSGGADVFVSGIFTR